ncbi:hypothetical protein RCZ04_05900 [Capnocytophaga sp. HP1101]
MSNFLEHIILDTDLSRLGSEALAHYVAHVLCHKGQYNFKFNGETFSLKAGEAMIIAVSDGFSPLQVSADFEATCIYVSPEYIERCTPRSNYGIRGSLALFANPVMPMSAAQFNTLKADFEQIAHRIASTDHGFQDNILRCALQMLFLDFFDIHASHNGLAHISLQDNDIMVRFMELLDKEAYLEHREVGYYAEQLFVTPKYLSQVCKRVSGRNALYWINRFTTIHLRKLLQAKEFSLTEIADKFNFSSMAYFTKFVQQHLGVLPSQFAN